MAQLVVFPLTPVALRLHPVQEFFLCPLHVINDAQIIVVPSEVGNEFDNTDTDRTATVPFKRKRIIFHHKNKVF